MTDAVPLLAKTICDLVGLKPISSAANADTLLIEVAVGPRSYFAPLPLKAVCEKPYESALLLAGCCAAKAVEWFVVSHG